MSGVVYLDAHATTPIDPEVLVAMRRFLEEEFGNASSTTHPIGDRAAQAVAEARAQVARFVGVPVDGVTFTSGATEANNLALLGLAAARRAPGRIVSAPTEHASILAPLRHLAERGWTIAMLPVDGCGRVDPDDLRAALRTPAALVTLMFANNEIGTVHPIRELAAAARERGVPIHTDAAQAAGWQELPGLGVDLMTLSAHKFHGPKGVGVLARGEGAPALAPLLHGGGQEAGLRPGTLNVAAIVGLGAACERAAALGAAAGARARELRDRLAGALRTLGDVDVHGAPEACLPNNLHVAIAGVHAEAVLLAAPEVAASTGAACESAGGEPSHVLRAIGLDAERIRSSIRLGLTRLSTEEDVERSSGALTGAVRRLRALAQGVSEGRFSSAS